MPAMKKDAPLDAVKLLIADHQEVKALFKAYDRLVKDAADNGEKQDVAQQICLLLKAHTRLEEELFYPPARDALAANGDEDLIDEADVEHAGAKALIAQIEAATPDEEPLYDAKVKVLGEYIDHHVKEEEDEMFPKLRKTDLDLAALGAQMAQRKEELAEEIGLSAAVH